MNLLSGVEHWRYQFGEHLRMPPPEATHIAYLFVAAVTHIRLGFLRGLVHRLFLAEILIHETFVLGRVGEFSKR